MTPLVTKARAQQNDIFKSMEDEALDSIINAASLMIDKKYTTDFGTDAVPEDMQEGCIQVMVLLVNAKTPMEVSSKLGDWTSIKQVSFTGIVMGLLRPYLKVVNCPIAVEDDYVRA